MDTDATREERDSLGAIAVPADRYWGAVTERARRHFAIGTDAERMPEPVVRAFGLQKAAAALVNKRLGLLDARLADAIAAAAREVAEGRWSDHFPLPVWQTGSGTQTNMNANEVIANRANEMLGAPLGARAPVHPNDHVNRSQSSNDSFPTVAHVAATLEVHNRLMPALERLHRALRAKAQAFEDIVKIGRTHLQDAVPMTLGQEFGAWAAQVENGIERVKTARFRLSQLAQGGTALGTGLNAPDGFDEDFCAELSALARVPFIPAPNKFEAIAAHDALVEMSGALNTLAVSLNKIGGDVRLLASGPRAGLAELVVPAGEPGSSIMPGKVNPTQAEALQQVCCQVMGNHVAITVAGAQGSLQLNTFKPVMAANLLRSIRLAADAAGSFAEHCIDGIEPDRKRIAALMDSSLMLVTALAPRIGYDKAAEIAKKAHAEGIGLREAALATGYVTPTEFDDWVDATAMTRPDARPEGAPRASRTDETP